MIHHLDCEIPEMVQQCPSICGKCDDPSNPKNTSTLVKPNTDAVSDEYYYDGDYEGYYQEWMARIEDSSTDDSNSVVGGKFSLAGLIGIVALVVVLAGVVAYHYRSIKNVKKTVNFMNTGNADIQMQLEDLGDLQQEMSRKVFNDSIMSNDNSFWDDDESRNSTPRASNVEKQNVFDSMFDKASKGGSAFATTKNKQPKLKGSGLKASDVNQSKFRYQSTDESLAYDSLVPTTTYTKASNQLPSALKGLIAGLESNKPDSQATERPKVQQTDFSSSEEDEEPLYDHATNVQAKSNFRDHKSPTY